jgi:hypothetical protein
VSLSLPRSSWSLRKCNEEPSNSLPSLLHFRTPSFPSLPIHSHASHFLRLLFGPLTPRSKK